METEQPFFILGLPRTRTAWLSVVMSMCGAPCFHEGMRDFTSFEAYADGREARGDADPTLIYWTSQLLDRWPDARFIVVSRDPDVCLTDLIAAAPPELETEIRQGWDGCMQAFAVTRDLLRGSPNAMFLDYGDLSDNTMVADLVAHVGGSRPSVGAVERWQRIRVTSHIIRPESVVHPRIPLPPDPRVKAADLCDITGLEVVMAEQRDFDMVSSWWVVHSETPLNESALPPLGVIVRLHGEPVAALWCYESYGAPVAELAFPVTRPGLSLKDARRSLLYAASCVIAAAGKGHEPEAIFRTFKVLAPVGMVRFLSRMGFKPMLTARKPMILTL